MSEEERRLQNLHAVARHLSTGTASETPGGEAAETPPPRLLSSSWKKWGSVGIILAFVLGKLKLIIPLLKFAKLHTLLSMLVAVWAYGMLWGVPFAVGFVLLIFVHELGHAIVLRQQGIHAGAPVFIPFVGAVIAMKGLPKNAYVEALVGIGGPILGSVGALACFLVGAATGSLFFYALAYTGFMLNLFNLIPISPLDGGRIVGVMSRWIWVLGYAIGIAVFFMTFHPILLLILLLGLFSLKRTIRGPREGYFDVPSHKRLAIGAAYFGLIVLLAVGMWAAEFPLNELRGV